MAQTDQLVDSRGVRLEVGQRVAYNLSGTIASGTILRLIEGEYEANHSYGQVWFRVKRWPIIRITPDNDFRTLASKKGYSDVRNPEGILVL